MTDLAAAMDARGDRIGEYAAETHQCVPVNALGPVPEDPLERLDWTERAAAIGAYRELYELDGTGPAERLTWDLTRADVTATARGLQLRPRQRE